MKPIEDTTTQELLEEASRQLIDERKHHAVGIIKNALNTVGKLSNDINTIEKQLEKKRNELDKATGFLDQLRSGRWDILVEFKLEDDEK